MLHLQWIARPNGTLEPQNDILVLPGNKWEKVPESSDRIYMLTLGQDRRRFFWMQEEAADGDEEIATKVNKCITDMSDPDGSAAAAASLAASSARPAAAGAAPVAARPPVPAPAPAAAGAAAAAPATSAASSTGAAGSSASTQEAARVLAGMAQSILAQRQRVDRAPLSLNAVLDSERVLPLVEDAKFAQALAPYLPESQRSPQAFREQLRSPQFQQALARLSATLNGPQYAAVMASLGLPYATQTEFGVEGFLRAIQELADKEKAAAQGSGSDAPRPPPPAGSS